MPRVNYAQKLNLKKIKTTLDKTTTSTKQAEKLQFWGDRR